ncbi:MAG: protein kinase [Bifidobacteriaceae bacterium]|jgi:serine/threonine-protein kinase|nr:protein kinase [Bifidobacteriaceae bacterium]
MEFHAGNTIRNRYLLIRQIGQGGMASMYLAKDELLHKDVAIKIQTNSDSSDPNLLARQRLEARNIAALRHRNIVKMIDYFEIDGIGILVTDYVEGSTLAELIDSKKMMPGTPGRELKILNYLEQIAWGLQAAHDAGIVHRDMKPSNVLLDKNGIVRITDFGISKSVTAADLTMVGIVVGTALYISPEQARGLGAIAQSDIYSLGVIAFELSQGYRPFTGTSNVDVAMKHIRNSVPKMPYPLSDEFEVFVRTMMAKDPSDRPNSATVVAEMMHYLQTTVQATQLLQNAASASSTLPVVSDENTHPESTSKSPSTLVYDPLKSVNPPTTVPEGGSRISPDLKTTDSTKEKKPQKISPVSSSVESFTPNSGITPSISKLATPPAHSSISVKPVSDEPTRVVQPGRRAHSALAKPQVQKKPPISITKTNFKPPKDYAFRVALVVLGVITLVVLGLIIFMSYKIITGS